MPTSASKAFCSNLSDGLHAAAQPLAILRASLGNNHLDGMAREELQELAARSATQVERVCRLFSCLQQLLNVESIEPQLTEVEMLPLVTHAADGVKLLFQDSGMFLNLVLPDDGRPVHLNRARTLEAFSSILLNVHALSSPGDTIEVVVSSSSADGVRVVVQNAGLSLERVNAEQRLNMALAEANIKSQQGGFSWSLKPYRVQMEF